MKYLKKLGKSLLYTLGITIVFTFLITIFSYFNIFSDNVVKVLKLFTPIISVFIGGFIIGKNSKRKGFLEGIKLGSIIDIFLIIISLLLKSFKQSSLLFYVILLTATIFGSMLGINKLQNK